ncbi:MAG: sulfite exporter TauE/SafE family protein [Gammaproteobacteria bacterium]|nr:sulfite exporter TauE/SafE family protein [Gammaproteobacteria bacterium]
MLPDPLFYLAAIPALLIVGVSKGGFGGGLGVLGLPILTLAVEPVQAAAVMLPVLCLMDLIGLRAYWNGWNGRLVALLASGAMLGILFGTLSYSYLHASYIRLLVGLIAVGFALNYWTGKRVAKSRRAGRGAALLWGSVSGFTSFVAHAGGPPINVYLLPLKLDKTVYLATSVAFFTLINYVKLIPYVMLGALDGSNLLISFTLLPLAAAGMWLGLRLHHRVSDDRFYPIAYLLLMLTGIKLLYDGICGVVT